MERRVLLAIFLAFIVLYTWQALFVKPVPKPPAGSAATTAEATPAASGAASASDSALQSAASSATAKPAVALAPALVAESTEREVRVETRDVIAIFTNKGARLKSWRLKRYLDQARQPQELIEHLPSQPLPFTLRAANDATTTTLNDGLYAVSGAPASASDSSPVDLRFEYSDSAGLHAVKEFHLDPASYIFGARTDVTENDQAITDVDRLGTGHRRHHGVEPRRQEIRRHSVPGRQGRAARREGHCEAVGV